MIREGRDWRMRGNHENKGTKGKKKREERKKERKTKERTAERIDPKGRITMTRNEKKKATIEREFIQLVLNC